NRGQPDRGARAAAFAAAGRHAGGPGAGAGAETERRRRGRRGEAEDAGDSRTRGRARARRRGHHGAARTPLLLRPPAPRLELRALGRAHRPRADLQTGGERLRARPAGSRRARRKHGRHRGSTPTATASPIPTPPRTRSSPPPTTCEPPALQPTGTTPSSPT